MGDKSIFVRVVRLLNFICAFLMLVDAFARFFDFDEEDDGFFYVLTFYLFGFAGLLILAEIRQEHVIMYLEFLKGRIGKGMYVILVGLLVFDDDRTIDTVLGIIITLVGIFNIIVGCMRDEISDDAFAYSFNKKYNNYNKE